MDLALDLDANLVKTAATRIKTGAHAVDAGLETTLALRHAISYNRSTLKTRRNAAGTGVHGGHQHAVLENDGSRQQLLVIHTKRIHPRLRSDALAVNGRVGVLAGLQGLLQRILEQGRSAALHRGESQEKAHNDDNVLHCKHQSRKSDSVPSTFRSHAHGVERFQVKMRLCAAGLATPLSKRKRFFFNTAEFYVQETAR